MRGLFFQFPPSLIRTAVCKNAYGFRESPLAPAAMAVGVGGLRRRLPTTRHPLRKTRCVSRRRISFRLPKLSNLTQSWGLPPLLMVRVTQHVPHCPTLREDSFRPLPTPPPADPVPDFWFPPIDLADMCVTEYVWQVDSQTCKNPSRILTTVRGNLRTPRPVHGHTPL